jgi:hypothetical protein
MNSYKKELEFCYKSKTDIIVNKAWRRPREAHHMKLERKMTEAGLY